MEFQLIETDDENSFDDDIEVNVLDNKFVDIHAEESTTLSFETWWPEIAESILGAMYSTPQMKKKIVQNLMPLFEFKRVDVQPLKLATEEVNELYRLYKQKLELRSAHLTDIKNFWCDLLRKCAVTCKQILQERETMLEILKLKAKEMYLKQSKVNRIDTIIKQEYEKARYDIQEMFTARLKLAKTEILLSKNNKGPMHCEKMAVVDESIRKQMLQLTQKYDFPEQLKAAYNAECKNLDYDMAQQVQNECREFWIHTLVPHA